MGGAIIGVRVNFGMSTDDGGADGAKMVWKKEVYFSELSVQLEFVELHSCSHPLSSEDEEVESSPPMVPLNVC